MAFESSLQHSIISQKEVVAVVLALYVSEKYKMIFVFRKDSPCICKKGNVAIA